MRLTYTLFIVLAILVLGAVGWTMHASKASAEATVGASLSQSVDSYARQRAAHPGHVMAAHRSVPNGGSTLVVCQILCAVAVSHTALAGQDSQKDRPMHRDRIAEAVVVLADQVTPRLQPAPPR